ncbi:hypothetical protein D3C77_652820 [compost metagenome]
MNTPPGTKTTRTAVIAIHTLPRLELGCVVGTSSFVDLFESAGYRQTVIDIVLTRYISGDWGLMGVDDCASNEAALDPATQDRIVAKYSVPLESGGEEIIYVITEADRSLTTLLLKAEY